jgi:mRNA interferase MazF
MVRGDLVVAAMQGDHGKPRPSLVIQSDLFDLETVTVLPLVSSQLVSALTRVNIEPTPANGLQAVSQIVVHRPSTIRRDKIGRVIGRADGTTMLAVTRALTVFLGLA